MLSLSRKIDYALVALACLAERYNREMPPVSARQIGEKYGLPVPLLMNLLKELAKANIVVSYQGQQGGYALAMDPQEVSLMRIITTIEGPIKLVQCAPPPESPEPPEETSGSSHRAAGNYSLVTAEIPGGVCKDAGCKGLEGETVEVRACGHEGGDETGCGCQLMQVCPIREPIRRLNERIREFLEQVTLADLAESKVDVPVGCVEV